MTKDEKISKNYKDFMSEAVLVTEDEKYSVLGRDVLLHSKHGVVCKTWWVLNAFAILFALLTSLFVWKGFALEISMVFSLGCVICCVVSACMVFGKIGTKLDFTKDLSLNLYKSSAIVYDTLKISKRSGDCYYLVLKGVNAGWVTSYIQVPDFYYNCKYEDYDWFVYLMEKERGIHSFYVERKEKKQKEE